MHLQIPQACEMVKRHLSTDGPFTPQKNEFPERFSM